MYVLAFYPKMCYSLVCRDPLGKLLMIIELCEGVIRMNLVDKITKKQIRTDLPEFRVGDTIKVNVRIIEGKRERIQAFEGIVIAIKGSGVSKNYTVRKKSSGIGVERTFPYSSPKVDSVEVIRKGKVRRAKLNYLRDLKGQAKIKERK